MDRRETTPARPSPREKFLNVVYFIDGAKTYNLKISLKNLMIIGAVGVLVLIWSVSSLILLTRSRSEVSDLKAEYKKSLAKILDYQVSSGKVYEQAYPQKEVAKAPVKEATQVIKEATEHQNSEQKVETPPSPVKEKQEVPNTLHVTASNPRFKKEAGGQISFAFDLKNENVNGQSEGYVWVVAEIQTVSGGINQVTVPTSVTLNPSGDIKNHKQAYRFSIKRFREREFKLKEPKDAVELKKATVYVTDANKSKIDKFEFQAGLKLRDAKADIKPKVEPKSGASRIQKWKRQLALKK